MSTEEQLNQLQALVQQLASESWTTTYSPAQIVSNAINESSPAAEALVMFAYGDNGDALVNKVRRNLAEDANLAIKRAKMQAANESLAINTQLSQELAINAVQEAIQNDGGDNDA